VTRSVVLVDVVPVAVLVVTLVTWFVVVTPVGVAVNKVEQAARSVSAAIIVVLKK
jgi:hypothetical protein